VKTIKSDRSPNGFTVAFSDDFQKHFQSLKLLLTKTMTEIDSLKTKSEPLYGTCNTSYTLRFITPDNVSSFVSNLLTAFDKQLITRNIGDLEAFTTESIRRFLKENECPPIEDYTVNVMPMFINRKAQTPSDLLTFASGEMYKAQVYSAWEIERRKEYVLADYKKFKDSYFTGTMANIVDALPKLIEKEFRVHFHSGNPGQYACDVIMQTIGEFILFAATLNSITLTNMLLYAKPQYTFSKAFDKTTPELSREEPFIECAQITTDLNLNSMTTQAQLPFDVNMRNVVMLDVHPQFKDTQDAIQFLMMNDRSPIRNLIIKYAEDGYVCKAHEYVGNCTDIARMFIGQVYSPHQDRDPFMKDPETQNGREDVTKVTSKDNQNFHTQLGWLDGIAWRNNWTDHNYRRDLMGNSADNSIVNTLDTIYKIYGSEDLRSNEALTRNICKVSDVMIAICKAHGANLIPNYHLTKDILMVFAEILTRNMLKLYWNNNHKITYSDNMEDTMIPGYLYNESFTVEDFLSEDGWVQEGKGGGKETMPQVTAANASNQAGAKPKVGLLQLIRNFGKAIVQKLSNIGINFSKNHAAEIDWVNKHKNLNQEIMQAMADGRFTPHVDRIPNFNLQAGAMIEATNGMPEQIRNLVNNKNVINETEIINNIIPNGINADQLADPKKVANNILYGTVDGVSQQSGIIGAKEWQNIIDSILGTPKAMEAIVEAQKKAFSQAAKILLDEFGVVDNTKKPAAQSNQPAQTAKATTESSEFDVDGDIFQEGGVIDPKTGDVVNAKPEQGKGAVKGYEKYSKPAETQQPQPAPVQQPAPAQKSAPRPNPSPAPGSQNTVKAAEQKQDGPAKTAEGFTPEQQQRAQQIFNIMQKTLTTYHVPGINTVARTFYTTYYSVYSQIVNLWNQQKSPAQQPQQSQQQQAAAPTQPATQGAT
jgi:hypothetical protein